MQPIKEELLNHYLTNVFDFQYLLADRSVSNLMMESAEANGTAKEAMCLLSVIHQDSLYISSNGNEIGRRFRSLVTQIFGKKAPFTSGDAIAALHAVSSFLFRGGKGNWKQWLAVAYMFSDGLLCHPYIWSSLTPKETQKYSFILTTTMWFDVLASVTLMNTPHFMHQYRMFFRPRILTMNESLSSWSSSSGLHPPLLMMTIMGCENHVVWAMAEISELALWKAQEQQYGRLSMPTLVQKGKDIEHYLLPRAGPPYAYPEQVEEARHHTAEIFRASTRVYLHSVISGDYPHCPEIMEGVRDTIQCLKNVTEQTTRRIVVRSVVFSIFMCGCLTDDMEQRQFLKSICMEQEPERVGNCPSVRELMQRVWKEWDRSPIGTPVPWRRRLNEEGLLLV
jgi:C6 transcription factor Pro1